jgi:hypothetical protein
LDEVPFAFAVVPFPQSYARKTGSSGRGTDGPVPREDSMGYFRRTLSLLLILSASMLYALSTGSITGTVRDTTGAVVPNADVTPTRALRASDLVVFQTVKSLKYSLPSSIVDPKKYVLLLQGHLSARKKVI